MSVIALLFVALGIFYIVYIATFFFRYDKICQKYIKWSEGEFSPPQKRINWLLLYGVFIVGLYFIIPYIAGFCVEAYLNAQGYTNGWEYVDETTIKGNYDSFTTYLIQKGKIQSWLGIAEFFSGSAIFIACIAMILKKRKLTKRYAYYEVLYGVLGFGAWASVIALIVSGFVFAIGLTIAAICLYIVGLIIHICFGEEITVEKNGFFGGVRKIWATKNSDGSATDINGNTYKPKD